MSGSSAALDPGAKVPVAAARPDGAATARREGRAGRAGRALLFVAIAIGAFAITAWGIRQLRPYPSDLRMRPKMEVFVAEKDSFDAIYVGSSKVYRSFLPNVIDPILSTPERPFRSYNLGFPGCFAFESARILEHVLDLEPKRLKWVFLEPMHYKPLVQDEGTYNERNVWAHDLPTTVGSLRSSWLELQHGDISASLLLEHAKRHVTLLCWNVANYGSGPAIVQRLLGLDDPHLPDWRERFRARGGFEPLTADPLMDQEELDDIEFRRRRFLKRMPDYWNYIDGIKKRQFQENVPAGLINVAMLERVKERVAAAGARLVFVLPPGAFRDTQAETMKTLGLLGDDVLWFQDFAKYPEFFDPKNHYDGNHFNEAGAAIFSRTFAESVRDDVRKAP